MLYSPCFKETKLLDGLANEKTKRNISYLMSLKVDNLLLPFKFEACLYSSIEKKTDIHWGWDSPLSQIRGTFTGHYLSACAKIWESTAHRELKARADNIVDIIRECQIENGGTWAFPIPEKYLYRIKNGKHAWASQYVCHKVMMGLLDMYTLTNNQVAFEILEGCTTWFYEFIQDISDENMQEMIKLEETGAMMELWSDLYKITNDKRHLELLKKYESKRIFDPMEKDIDALTNHHANNTIPEIHGAASAYESTGDIRYRKIVENYWNWAITKRGSFATGGETSGEVYCPPHSHSSRLGDRNQEHCVVYNLMRLSQYLFKWTGDKKYSDYYEKNLYNGIYAQGFYESAHTMFTNEDSPVEKGLVCYYLPLEAGAKKQWGSETNHFWCCHSTLVQANASFHESIYYKNDDEIIVTQYIPSKLELDNITLTQKNVLVDDFNRPKSNTIDFVIESKNYQTMKFRIPDWSYKTPSVFLNEKITEFKIVDGYIVLNKKWSLDKLKIVFPKQLIAFPLEDRPDTVAFLDGPILLVGLIDYQPCLYGNINDPYSLLIPDNEKRWGDFLPYYRTINQNRNIRFVPIYEIGYEAYTTYFQIK